MRNVTRFKPGIRSFVTSAESPLCQQTTPLHHTLPEKNVGFIFSTALDRRALNSVKWNVAPKICTIWNTMFKTRKNYDLFFTFHNNFTINLKHFHEWILVMVSPQVYRQFCFKMLQILTLHVYNKTFNA